MFKYVFNNIFIMAKTIKKLIQKNFILMDPETPVQKLRTKLDSYILINKGKVVTVLDYFSLLSSKTVDDKMQIDDFSTPVPVLDENTEPMDALSFLIDSGLNYVPVAKGKKIIGVVDLLTLFKDSWKKLNTKSKLNMKKLMLKNVYVKNSDKLSKVINIMRKNKVYIVPVLEDDKFLGVCKLHEVLKAMLISKVSKKEKGSKTRGSTKRATNTSERTRGISNLPVSNFITEGQFITNYDTTSVVKNFINSKLSNFESKYAIIKGKTTSVIPLRHFVSMLLYSSKKNDWNLSVYGLNRYKLNEFEKLNIKKKIEFFCSSISREINKEFTLKISFKQYAKSGKKHKWTITALLLYPGAKFEAKEDGWKMDIILVKVLNELKEQIKTHHSKKKTLYKKRRTRKK